MKVMPIVVGERSFQSPDFHLAEAESLGELIKYRFPELQPQLI